MNLSVAFRFNHQEHCILRKAPLLNVYLRNVRNERQMKTAMACSK